MNEVHLARVRLAGHEVGITSTSGGFYLFLEDCRIEHNASHGASLRGQEMRLRSNRFYFNGHGSGAGSGLFVSESGNCLVSTGNEFYANAGNGVCYQGNTTKQTFHVGDVIDSNGRHGLFARGMRVLSFSDGWIGSNGVRFRHDQPDYASFQKDQDGLVAHESVLRLRVLGCQITNNARHGLNIQGSHDVQVSSNQVYGNGQGEPRSAGLRLTDGAGDSTWKSALLLGNRVWTDGGTANPASASALRPSDPRRDRFISSRCSEQHLHGDAGSFLHKRPCSQRCIW